MGRFSNHWRVLAPTPRNLGGDLPACYGRWLLCERIQKPHISLRSYGTIVSDSRSSLALLKLNTHQGRPHLGRCSRRNRSRILAGMALLEKASAPSLKWKKGVRAIIIWRGRLSEKRRQPPEECP